MFLHVNNVTKLPCYFVTCTSIIKYCNISISRLKVQHCIKNLLQFNKKNRPRSVVRECIRSKKVDLVVIASTVKFQYPD